MASAEPTIASVTRIHKAEVLAWFSALKSKKWAGKPLGPPSTAPFLYENADITVQKRLKLAAGWLADRHLSLLSSRSPRKSIGPDS
ncbi:hypothetical protein FQN50_006800 [Emmonsiellopsis sp. PD_5]|nr:hypothetical protein FQN50_006800 [Emmonsiellopsis sp. PD_5]